MKDEADVNKTLLTFPCDFIIKVFGLGTDEFEAAVLALIRKHIPTLGEGAVRSRPSANGKYRALTITVHVTSKEQLDNIYKDLSSSSHVLMAL